VVDLKGKEGTQDHIQPLFHKLVSHFVGKYTFEILRTRSDYVHIDLTIFSFYFLGTTITGIIGMRNPNGIIGIITEIIIIIRDVPANFSLSMALVVMEIVADLHTNNNLLETRWMF